MLNTILQLKPLKAIPFDKRMESWSGSEIPLLKKKIDFYKRLYQELNGIRHLEHKVYIEAIIEEYEKSIHSIK